MTRPSTPILDRLLDAAIPHVPFSGWTEETFQSAARECGIPMAEARAACPGGPAALAARFHEAADARMVARLEAAALSDMRVRDRIAFAIDTRLKVAGDKEVVRRGVTLFSLPHMAPRGAALLWQTADAMWRGIGDNSDDVNWYTKRMTLSAVWSSVLLFWLGDTSDDHAATRAFIERRIEDVMRIEKAKSEFRTNPVTRPLADMSAALLRHIRPPAATPADDLPGRWSLPRG